MATMAQRAEEGNKEYLTVQMRPGRTTGKLNVLDLDGQTQKPLQVLLEAGWKIEREFMVNKVEKNTWRTRSFTSPTEPNTDTSVMSTWSCQ